MLITRFLSVRSDRCGSIGALLSTVAFPVDPRVPGGLLLLVERIGRRRRLRP